MTSFFKSYWTTIAPPLALGVFATTAVYLAAGPSLGLAVGGFFVATILTPILTCEMPPSHRLAAWAAIAVGIGGIWLTLVGPERATLGQWLAVVLALAAYGFSLMGAVALLERLKIAPVLAAAAVTIAGLAWLTWPIWLSPAIAGGGTVRFIPALVRVHPPLVANGVLVFTSPWTEQTIAYGWTVLDQDVMIALPASVMACILFHACLGGVMLGASLRKARHGMVAVSSTP